MILRDVIGIGIKRIEHLIDSGVSDFRWTDVVYVKLVYFLKQGGENVNVLGDFEIAVGRRKALTA